MGRLKMAVKAVARYAVLDIAAMPRVKAGRRKCAAPIDSG